MVLAPYLTTGLIFNHSKAEFIKLFPDTYTRDEKKFDHFSMKATLATVAFIVSTILLIPLLFGIPQYFYRRMTHYSKEMETILENQIYSCKWDYERNFRLKVHTDKAIYTNVQMDDLKIFLENNCFSTYEQFQIFTEISQACFCYILMFYCKELWTDEEVSEGDVKFRFFAEVDDLIQLDFRKGRKRVNCNSKIKIKEFYQDSPILQTFKDKACIDIANNTITIQRYLIS